MVPLHFALRIAAGCTGLLAGVYDLRYRRIPNWLVGAGMLAGFALQGATSGWGGLRVAALGLLLAAAVYVPLYILRAVGGGDVKLMAALGAMLGPGNWLLVFVLASLLGGIAAMLIVLAQGRAARTLSNIGVILRELFHFSPPYRNRPDLDVNSPTSARLPHGAVIAVAVVLYLLAASVSP